MSALRFRNLDVSPEEPVEDWPFEGVVTAIERGALPDWQRLAAAIKAEPLFARSPLVVIGRLSVVPLTEAQWEWFVG